MRIGSHNLDDAVLVIAEIGNNHEGDVDLAEEMLVAAAQAGADAVKFQMIDPAKLVACTEEARRAQLMRYQLTREDFLRLAAAAKREGVTFLCTPFDIAAVDFLKGLVPAFKVASGDNDFVALLEAVARTGEPVLMSTGLADIAAVSRSKDVIEAVWAEMGVDPGLVLLHCVSSYPVEPDDARLGAIRDLMGLGATVGYSDHTLGVDAAVLAVAAGARVVEKHFTLSNELSDFRDHALSAEPSAFKQMVERIRSADRLLGRCGSADGDGEQTGAHATRRSIAAARDLDAGYVVRSEDLTWLRPGSGFRPGQEDLIVGRELVRPVAAGQIIERDDLG